MPSINWCGSFSISRRSLQVPGSLSSAFTTMYFGLGEVRGTKLHFMPGGKARAAASAQVRDLHFLDDLLRLHPERPSRTPCSRRSPDRYRCDAEFGRPKRRVSTLTSSGLRFVIQHRLLDLPQAVEQPVQFLRRHVVVEIVIHLHRRRPRARADALHFFERNLPVGRDFLVPDAQLLAGMLPQLLAAASAGN